MCACIHPCVRACGQYVTSLCLSCDYTTTSSTHVAAVYVATLPEAHLFSMFSFLIRTLCSNLLHIDAAITEIFPITLCQHISVSVFHCR